MRFDLMIELEHLAEDMRMRMADQSPEDREYQQTIIGQS